MIKIQKLTNKMLLFFFQAPKGKKGKGKKGKAKNPKTPTVVEGISTEEMTKEQVIIIVHYFFLFFCIIFSFFSSLKNIL
jgi:hypothetical protein